MNEDRLTVEVVTAIPGEARLAMRGDVDIAADETLAAAYAAAAAAGRDARRPRLRERGLHQLDRHRADRPAPGRGAARPPRGHRPRASPTTTARSSGSPACPTTSRSPTPRRRRPSPRRRPMTDTTVDVDPRRLDRDPPDPRRDHRGQRAADHGRLRRGRRARSRSSSTSASLDYMNSGGIGLLVTLLVRTQRAGQRLLAVGPARSTTARSSR